jgi:hypothetical protein
LPPIQDRRQRSAKGFRPVAEMAGGVLDPVLRKRAGLVVDLLQSWDEIMGRDLAGLSRPLKVAWQRRAQDGDPFIPGTLVIACEGFAAMRIQHQTAEVCGRVNAFCGFAAIDRIRIEQRPVEARRRVERKDPSIGADAEARLRTITAAIEDEGLRIALQRLGRSVKATPRQE